eukprot:scaffold1242_cov123-Isochrysis_galbana.AAC.2
MLFCFLLLAAGASFWRSSCVWVCPEAPGIGALIACCVDDLRLRELQPARRSAGGADACR